mmetsp:Transcript_10032/g.21893  ORF Transcript_10032/g.21893 Transcript_10032/m.21893 type:complete len:256 (-) Transcript_10032:309-1076(-)
MASCPFGKASMCFPLEISAEAVVAAVGAATENSDAPVPVEVAGYTTQKTRAAGAHSLRLLVRGDPGLLQQGAYLVAVRTNPSAAWLIGLAGIRGNNVTDRKDAMEVVILARPDVKFTSVMYLPEETLQLLFPVRHMAEARFLKFLRPTQHDCPEQWLRDRLLRLANMVEEDFAPLSKGLNDVQTRLERHLRASSLSFQSGDAVGRSSVALPADHGDRISQEELGYWDEEMRLNTRCAASMNGGSRLDYFMSHLPA